MKLNLSNVELVSNWKSLSVNPGLNRHREIANSVQRHVLGFAKEMKCILPSCVKTEVSNLEHFCLGNIQLLTDSAQRIKSHGIPLSAENPTVPLSSLSLAHQGRYFTLSIKGIRNWGELSMLPAVEYGDKHYRFISRYARHKADPKVQ